MAQTFPISARTLQTGVTAIPEQNLPLGTSTIVLTLDVGSMTAGQVIDFLIEVWNGGEWLGFRADMTGPWRDKQNVLHTDSALNIGWSQPSEAGWKGRASFTVTNGPIATAGGSLVLK